MVLDMQELSSNSSSDGEFIDRTDFELPDTEIARALGQPTYEEMQRVVPASPSRWRRALTVAGTMFLVVGVLAAMGFIFYGEREISDEQQQLRDELFQVESFVQYEPELLVLPEEELADVTLKTTDPPPM